MTVGVQTQKEHLYQSALPLYQGSESITEDIAEWMEDTENKESCEMLSSVSDLTVAHMNNSQQL